MIVSKAVYTQCLNVDLAHKRNLEVRACIKVKENGLAISCQVHVFENAK